MRLINHFKNLIKGKSRFSSDFNHLYYNFHDLSSYIDYLGLEPDDAIKDLSFEPTLTIPFFTANATLSEIKNQLGKSVIQVPIDTLPGLKIYHFKKIIQEGIKVKYNFHFFKAQLVFYSEVYPYLNQQGREKMFRDFLKQQNIDNCSLQKRCVFTYDNLIVLVENSVDLSFHYIIKNTAVQQKIIEAKSMMNQID